MSLFHIIFGILILGISLLLLKRLISSLGLWQEKSRFSRIARNKEGINHIGTNRGVFDFKNSDKWLIERRLMVENQLKLRGIKNETVLKSMLTVPRHCFVPANMQKYAYLDGPLPIGEGQTISQPYIVALMAELLEPSPGNKVLEIGTGSGYAAAVLAQIVSKVYTIERHASLAAKAQEVFKALDYRNIITRVGDGTKGWPEEAPFDGILVSAGAPGVPESLCNQLKPGGRLVTPAGDRQCQELLLVRRNEDGSFSEEKLGEVVFVPLIGEEGWHQE